MPSFPERVFRVLKQLQVKHRFVPARALNHRKFASLLRKETDDVFVSILIHDGRSGGGNVDVHLWIAPPETPDDSLDKLYVGYKVLIGSEYEVDSQFFLNSENRIINFLPCIQGMIPSILSELTNPAFDTLRWHSYKLQRQTFSAFMQAVTQKNKEAVRTLESVRRLSQGKSTYVQIEEECTQIASILMSEDKLESGVVEHHQSKPEWIGSSIARQLYAYALAELSESQSHNPFA